MRVVLVQQLVVQMVQMVLIPLLTPSHQLAAAGVVGKKLALEVVVALGAVRRNSLQPLALVQQIKVTAVDLVQEQQITVLEVAAAAQVALAVIHLQITAVLVVLVFLRL